MAQEKKDQHTEQIFLVGRLLVTIFHNSNNLFTIAKVRIRKTNSGYPEKEIVVKGHFPPLSEEEEYRFEGRLVEHPTYGIQFDVSAFAKELPETEAGLIHYLSSDLFPGIGRKTAQTIVHILGKHAIQKIIEDPKVLDEVPRLSNDKKDTLRSVLQENLGLERTMVQLADWGFGPQLSMKIYQLYQDETLEVITKNPYRLTEEVQGIGFLRADELGKHLGLHGDHPDRLKAAVLYVIHEKVNAEGHVYVEAENILQDVKRLLESSQPHVITYDQLSTMIIALVEEGKLCVEERKLYLPSLYYSEIGLTSRITKLLQHDVSSSFPIAAIRQAIGEVEERLNVQYAENQVAAIETALQSSLMILTGGPGTGKTTVIRGLVEVYAELHGLSLDPKFYAKNDEPFPIILAAPTGRAAKRMSESTGLPAMTIHRLLGFNGQESETAEARKVEGRFVIVDEMSMVDTWLAYQLLNAIDDEVQVLLVGDQDQLPPVGPGQVLKDLLASNHIPTVALTEIYRQGEGSTIVELAHAIKRSTWTQDMVQKTKDRSFIATTADRVPEVIEQIVQNALTKGFSIKDIQVLAPMYRGPIGIDGLNKMLQQLVNPPSPNRKELSFADVTYRIGDKVLQLVNQPDSNVFNGDMGEVVAILKAKETVDRKDLLVVSFEGNEVSYERSDLHQLTLAYCCSIHKSQGSEFPIVIMPIVRSYRKMLRKNLLYTGITRAKDFLILCGEQEEFKQGMMRTDELKRQTTLRERLDSSLSSSTTEDEEYESFEQPVQQIEKMDETYQLTSKNVQEIHPLIGMGKLSPYDFLDEVESS